MQKKPKKAATKQNPVFCNKKALESKLDYQVSTRPIETAT
jgi:hypothetical protein